MQTPDAILLSLLCCFVLFMLAIAFRLNSITAPLLACKKARTTPPANKKSNGILSQVVFSRPRRVSAQRCGGRDLVQRAADGNDKVDHCACVGERQSADQSAMVVADVDGGLAALRSVWMEQLRPKLGSTLVDGDPLLRSNRIDSLLCRVLRAEAPDRRADSDAVQRAAARVEATVRFRHEYACGSFHRKGMARRLLMHASNAGASVYFGDCGIRSLTGRPVLIGRVSLMTSDSAPGAAAMQPAQHLRACLFVVERCMALLEPGAKGSYILDVGSYPAAEMAAHHHRYWDEDGMSVDSSVAVGPHLPGHDKLRGLAVLKEALRLLERHYPETLRRVYFYRPGPTFRFIFAAFRLWVAPSTRERFVLVRKGEEQDHFFADEAAGGCGLDRHSAPREIGGSGPSLDGDRFLLRACTMYDEHASET